MRAGRLFLFVFVAIHLGCAVHDIYRPVDWFEVRESGGGPGLTFPADTGGMLSLRRGPTDWSFYVRLPSGQWKQVVGPHGAWMWVLGGGASLLMERTIYLKNDAKEVQLPGFCKPIVDGNGRSVFCSQCEKETTEPSCLQMHVVEFDYLGTLVREYRADLGPRWDSEPDGLAREGDLVVKRPSNVCVDPDCINHQCAVGTISDTGLQIRAEAPTCTYDWFNREIARWRRPRLKRVEVPTKEQ